MNNSKRVSAAALATSMLLLASGSSYGLGFGRPNSHAILGDTLSVSVPLRLEAGEEIANDCLAADVYFGDDKVAAAAVQASVLPGEGSERVLKVRTTALINEPVVTVYLAAGCKARVTRKFVAFADPPGMNMPVVAEVAEPALPVVAPAQKATPSLPAGTRAPTRAAIAANKQPPDAQRLSGAGKAVRSAQATAPAPAVDKVRSDTLAAMPSATLTGKASAPAKALKRSAAPAPDAARLLLDPVEADATVIPSLQMAAALGSPINADDATAPTLARRAAAAALWQAMNASPEQLARDRQRLQELEQRLAQLKQEGDQAQSAVKALQARVQQAESQRMGPTASLALLVLAVGGVALSAYLFWQLRKRKQAEQDAWWKAEAAQLIDDDPAFETDRSHLEDTAAGFVSVPAPAAAAQSEPLSVAFAKDDDAKASVPAPLRSAALHQLVPDAVPAPLPPPQPENLREVSVEELIDLEQQADFFVVLGQDAAAIELLESHVNSTAAASPLPLLKLLETYQRLGRRADYERIQAEFNQRFNAHAPVWEADLQHGLSLIDYPGVVDRLQSLWPSPARAMSLLETSLTRADAEADTFELPAYRELLFLYAVARDLAERESANRGTVDLLLPVPDVTYSAPMAPAVRGVRDTAMQPLMATLPVQAQPGVSPSISLDLHLDELHEQAAQAKSAAVVTEPLPSQGGASQHKH